MTLSFRLPMTVLAIGLASTAIARAAQLAATSGGDRLDIASPCAARIAVAPDASRDGSVAVLATADRQEELDQLAIGPRRGAVAVRRRDPTRACWRPAGDASWSPTLAIAIRVPPRFPISIDEAGVGHIEVGPVGGALTVDASGDATVAVATARSLGLDLSGRSNVSVGTVAGPTVVRLSGAGEVRIDHLSAPTLSIALAGTGTVAVGDGAIGRLAVDDDGAGRVSIGGTTGDAAVSLSGSGAVHVARLTGSLRKSVSGLGSVTVGR